MYDHRRLDREPHLHFEVGMQLLRVQHYVAPALAPAHQVPFAYIPGASTRCKLGPPTHTRSNLCLQPPLEDTWDEHSRKSPPESDKKESKSDVVLNMPIPEVHSVGGVLVHMPHVCSVRRIVFSSENHEFSFEVSLHISHPRNTLQEQIIVSTLLVCFR